MEQTSHFCRKIVDSCGVRWGGSGKLNEDGVRKCCSLCTLIASFLLSPPFFCSIFLPFLKLYHRSQTIAPAVISFANLPARTANSVPAGFQGLANRIGVVEPRVPGFGGLRD